MLAKKQLLTVISVLILSCPFLACKNRPATPDLVFHPTNIYASAHEGPLYCPFDIQIDPMERLLLINFENDPDTLYFGFEPQVFNDTINGQGMLVIAWRTDGRIDVYHQPGLSLDPGKYDIVAGGLASMIERPMEDAFFEVSDTGVQCYFAFDDLWGRALEVRISERSTRKRKPFGLLAPMGHAAEAPSSMPLVLLHDFYFVRRSNTDIVINVNGNLHKPGRLPVPMDGSRMYFARYSPDPLIATINTAQNGPIHCSAKADTDGQQADIIYNQGYREIAAIRKYHKDHEVVIAFNPPLPDLVNLADGASEGGAFTISSHVSTGMIDGEYTIERNGNSIRMVAIPSGGWSPNEKKLSVRFMYRTVDMFRNWPKTYRWEANINLQDDLTATMTSAWERTQ